MDYLRWDYPGEEHEIVPQDGLPRARGGGRTVEADTGRGRIAG